MADSYGGGTTVPGEDDVTRGGPSTPNAPERECWYINMGAVSRDDFAVDAMVKNAP